MDELDDDFEWTADDSGPRSDPLADLDEMAEKGDLAGVMEFLHEREAGMTMAPGRYMNALRLVLRKVPGGVQEVMDLCFREMLIGSAFLLCRAQLIAARCIAASERPTGDTTERLGQESKAALALAQLVQIEDRITYLAGAYQEAMRRRPPVRERPDNVVSIEGKTTRRKRA